MASPLYYLLTFLPPLPALGEPLPIGFDELQACVERENRPEVLRLIEAVRLEERIETLVLRRFHEAAEDGSPAIDPSGAGPLPDTIAAALSESVTALGEDRWLTGVWRAYYRWLAQAGRALGSSLLEEWAIFESDLREELATHRLERFQTGSPGAVVAKGVRFADLISAWERAGDPFAGEHLLDEARWGFLERRCGVFSFSIDECVGYVLRLRLLNRYQRLDRARGEQILREVAGL